MIRRHLPVRRSGAAGGEKLIWVKMERELLESVERLATTALFQSKAVFKEENPLQMEKSPLWRRKIEQNPPRKPLQTEEAIQEKQL
jgi:hypothetical protein